MYKFVSFILKVINLHIFVHLYISFAQNPNNFFHSKSILFKPGNQHSHRRKIYPSAANRTQIAVVLQAGGLVFVKGCFSTAVSSYVCTVHSVGQIYSMSQKSRSINNYLSEYRYYNKSLNWGPWISQHLYIQCIWSSIVRFVVILDLN